MSNLNLFTPIKFLQDLQDKIFPHLKTHPGYVFGCEECSAMYPPTDACSECGRPFDECEDGGQ